MIAYNKMISAIILSHNSEHSIEKAIKSVIWCDETILIDDDSSDKTTEIASKYKIIIHKRRLNDNFSNQRNFGLQIAKGDWVLFLDSDEIISTNLRNEIVTCIKEDKYNGYYICREDYVWDIKLKNNEMGRAFSIRLAKRNRGQWEGIVHEKWIISGNTKKLNNPIYHYPHKSISYFITKINYYTELRSKELFKRKKKVRFLDIAIYPLVKFFQVYIIKHGYEDGTAGIIISFLMSLHSFLVRAKLWQLWQNQ